MELYSLHTLKPIAKLIQKGNGPYDLTSCITFINSSIDPNFLIQDRSTDIYYLTNIDSILQYKRFSYSKKINFGHNIHPDFGIVSLDNNNYYGYNMWYLNDRTYSSSNDPILKVSSDYNETQYNENFVAAVNGAYLIPIKEQSQIMIADAREDNIKILDDSLKVVKEIIGPDFFSPKYVVAQNSPMEKFISFSNEQFYRAYTNYTITDNFIYLIYEGTNSFNPLELKSVEVFKFDKKGNPITRYELDRYIYNISIDSKEEYLYGTHRSSLEDYPMLLKYKL